MEADQKTGDFLLHRLGLIFISSLILAGCGTGLGKARQPTSTAVDTSVFYIASFSPTPGIVAGVPSTIVINFTQAVNPIVASAVSSYTFACNGYTSLAAASVAAGQDSAVVSVTLPSGQTVASGTPCTFTVSSNVTNKSGTKVLGSTSVVYVVN